MKITKMKIENFRLLTNVEIDIENDLTLIVGKNNSGKTSFLNFLSIIEQDNNSISLNDYPIKFRNDLYNSILDFINHNIEFKDLKQEVKVPCMKFYIDYAEDKDSDNLGYLSNFIIDLDENLYDAEIEVKYELLDNEELIREKFNDCKTKEEIRNNLNDYFGKIFSQKIYAVNPKDEEDRLLKDSSEFRRLIRLYKVPAERDLDESENKNVTPFKELLTELFKDDAEQSISSSNLKDELIKLKKIIKEVNKGTQDELDKNLTKIIANALCLGYPNENNLKVQAQSKIDIKNEITSNSDLIYGYNDSKELLPETYNGLGYKNLLMIEFKLASFIREIERNESSIIPILFIEEPESHMHPQIQQIFIMYISDYIKKLSTIGKVNFQAIITTHSSHISSNEEFNKIRYARRIKDSVEYKNLNKFIKENNYENVEFIKKYLTLTNCDMFFADKIILVEGAAERILMNDFIDKYCEETKKSDKYLQLKNQYYSVIEVGGAYAYRFIDFLNFLGTPTLIITDIDSVKQESSKSGKKLWKSCLVSEGQRTCNATIKNWFNNDEISICDLLNKDSSEKTKKFIHIEYQIKEDESQYCGRSLEEAIKNCNRKEYKIEQEQDLELETKMKKTDFALELIEKYPNYKVPKYILNGLKWLEEQKIYMEDNNNE